MRSPTFSFERALIKQGHQFIAGVDEVGCGAWAGPVYAAAVVLSPGKKLPGARDSKTLSHEQRERLSTTIKKVCLSWAIGVCSVEEIAALNIRGASLLATQRALAGLSVPPDWILSDAFPVPGVTPCTPIVRGDALSKSIAAASIVAKVARDTFMTEHQRTSTRLGGTWSLNYPSGQLRADPKTHLSNAALICSSPPAASSP